LAELLAAKDGVPNVQKSFRLLSIDIIAFLYNTLLEFLAGAALAEGDSMERPILKLQKRQHLAISPKIQAGFIPNQQQFPPAPNNSVKKISVENVPELKNSDTR